MRTRILTASAGALLFLGGCTGSPQSSNAGSPSTAVTGTDAVVPGGAPVVVSPGSPDLCRALAESSGLRGLSDAVGAVAVSGTASPADAQLHQAAQDLRRIAAGNAGALADSMTKTAQALDAVAIRGADDAAAMQTLSQDLTTLAMGVQSLCHFPVG